MGETTPTPQASFKPGTYYFRAAYRSAASTAEREELFAAVCREIEHLREWCRQRGMIPPKFELTPEEIADKPWLLEFIPPCSQSEFPFAEDAQEHRPEQIEFFLPDSSD